MFKNERKEKFSLRKYKDGRTDSKLIGATLLVGMGLLASGGTALANVSSNGTDTATVVSDTSKVASTSATIFTDDTTSKTVKVDAVLGKDVAEPTKANHNTGDVDGNDTVNFKTEATVNYKLESDKSELIPTETVKVGEGTVTTPYDKKGIAYDTDGKDYRKSTVSKTGDAVTEATGKKETVEANNKVYEYVRSEVEGADKATYDKTSFNNIEARVSPEGMHNKLGEIDYTKTTGKVYLVEETADGQYGKFVEANGVTSDEDAVAKWKAGQENAKDFTKENVTLQEGDTILVMDKDTYAVGDSKKVTTTKKYSTQSFELELPSNEEETKVNSLETYLLNPKEITATEFYKAGADGVFGTADDVAISNVTEIYKLGNDYEGYNKNDFFKAIKKADAELVNATPVDILKNDYHYYYYQLLKFAKEKAKEFEDSKGLKEVEAATEKLNKLVEAQALDYANNGYDIGYIRKADGGIEYGYHPSQLNYDTTEKYSSRAIEKAIGDFTVKQEKSTKQRDGNILKTTTIIDEYKYLSDDDNFYIATFGLYRTTKIKYDVVATKEEIKQNLIETIPSDQEIAELTKKGTISIAEDGTVTVASPEELVEFKVYKDFTEEEIKEKDGLYENEGGNFFSAKEITANNTTTFTTKEVITPIRAYKVMSEAKPVVTHYYNLKITREEAGTATATKQGSVVIKYVTTDGKPLKSETDKENVTLETKTIVSLYSGETKVDERTDVATVEQNYDTTPKQYPTLVDADTGFTYEYVGLKQDSPAASGKVVEGRTEVVYEYRLVSEEEKTPSKSEVTKTGSVDVKHVVINEDGTLKTLKETEVVKNNVPLEYEDTYVTYSKGVKVSERKEKRTVTERYDTTDKQYSTLKDEATGLVYKYVGLTSDSAPATGDVTEGEKHVIYSYTLDKQEETTPSKVVETKGSVVVKFVDANGNEIKDAENVVTDAVVKTTKTYATKSGDVVLSTRDEVTNHDVDYSTESNKVQTIITAGGKKYTFYRVLPVDTKFNNVTEETGKVKEGTTTVVYQYDEIIPVDPNKPNNNTPNTPNPGDGTPNDPTKPNDNTPNTPKPGDKIPNDPQNRTYEQLGVLKEVKRNITYVYENGPKAGQEASTPVNQNARFTRTAEINSRTGEVVYTSEWTKEQKLAEVVSPKIDKYSVDKEKVAELSVTHESTDSSEVVKYRENPDTIDHDADKDKKGTVIVKFVDEQGNEIATPVTVKENAIVEKATTKVYADRDAETTYTVTNEEYSTVGNRKETIEFNGKKYVYQRVLPVSTTLGNSDKESGKVPEGTTTVIYQYAEEVDPFIPPLPPTVEVPGFEGKVDDAEKDKKGTVIVKFVDINENVLASDVLAKDNVVVEKASTIIAGDKVETTYTATGEEYAVTAPQTIEVDGVTFKLRRVLPASDKFNNTVEEKGLVKEGVTTIVYQYVMQIGAPSVEKPEHEGGVVPLDPPTVDKPEYEGGVVPLDPPTVDKPEYEGGIVPLDPPTVDKPEYEGGVVPLDPPTVDKPEYEGGVVPLDPPTVDKPELDIPEEPAPAPKPETKPEPKTPGKENVPGQPGASAQVKRLANTGSETNNMAAVGFAALVAGIALAVRKRQREE